LILTLREYASIIALSKMTPPTASPDLAWGEAADGSQFLFGTLAAAQKAAGFYYRRLMDSDPELFCSLVGFGCVLNWAQGKPATPGDVECATLEDWLVLSENYPEECFGTENGETLHVTHCDDELRDALGFIPEVAYLLMRDGPFWKS